MKIWIKAFLLKYLPVVLDVFGESLSNSNK